MVCEMKMADERSSLCKDTSITDFTDIFYIISGRKPIDL